MAALAPLLAGSRPAGTLGRPTPVFPYGSLILLSARPGTFSALHRSTDSPSLTSIRCPLSHSISGNSSLSSREKRLSRESLVTVRSRSVVRRSESRRLAPTCAMGSGPQDGSGKKLGVLFVCLGNICRSPTAEAVFRDVVKKHGMEDRFHIDSAGTIDYHEGNPADSRMRRAAAQRGIDITSISRPIRASDFTEFDLIMAMDNNNLNDIRKAYNTWSRNMDLPADGLDRVGLICDYCKTFDTKEVPDPYYGGPQGFELVLDLLDDACTQLFESVKAKAQG